MERSNRVISSSSTIKSRPPNTAGDLLPGGLHQDFHRHQRIAQLVGNPGGHLPNRRQLLRPQRLTLTLVQSFDDGADFDRDFVQNNFGLLQAGLDDNVIGPTILFNSPAASWIGTLSRTIERL